MNIIHTQFKDSYFYLLQGPTKSHNFWPPFRFLCLFTESFLPGNTAYYGWKLCAILTCVNYIYLQIKCICSSLVGSLPFLATIVLILQSIHTFTTECFVLNSQTPGHSSDILLHSFLLIFFSLFLILFSHALREHKYFLLFNAA